MLMAATAYKAGYSYLGWLSSPKLDGIRAFWDGGISRGKISRDVLYANTDCGKDNVVCTGMWSRDGKVLPIPLGIEMPDFCLDGELVCNTGRHEETVSLVRTSDWSGLRYYIFDAPHIDRVFNGLVKGHSFGDYADYYASTYAALREYSFGPFCQVIEQKVMNKPSCLDDYSDYEGVMYRKPDSFWIGGRSKFLVKHKSFLDCEVKVVGYVLGEGKYVGCLGSLECKTVDGVTVYVGTGFNDIERVQYKLFFPIGKSVTIKYGRLGSNGAPIEPRYWRISQ